MFPFFSESAYAKGMKIGYVDAERIFVESEVGRDGMDQMKKFEEEKKEELDTKKDDIDKMEEELRNQYFTLTTTAKEQREEEIKQAKIELKRLAEDADREMNRMQKTYLEKIDREVIEIIEEVGAEQGYTLIFGKIPSTILYADESIDITGEIIKRYDALHKK